MIIGYWNSQRATAPSGGRYGYIDVVLRAWMRGKLGVLPPDIFVLSEVTQAGRVLAAYLNGAFTGYEAKYVPVRNKWGNASPCSFLVFGRRPLPDVRPVGISPKRPAITMNYKGRTVAAVHVIAGRPQKALDEAFEFCAENLHKAPAMIIGDLNFNFRSLGKADKKPFADIGFRPIFPGMTQTFKAGQIYDYAWVTMGPAPAPKPPLPFYNRWGIIDHAPIAYEM